ncbi:unnamed protein product [Symbiodinium natans]|uniref:Uncharacterized protein n=1 Tax=Symbiodinium natans TaxID=878477 RepID=A0A812N8K4_9DINO|nr:unnamed protein product [Symbiodinium natans]
MAMIIPEVPMTPRKFPVAPRKHRLPAHSTKRALCVVDLEIDLGQSSESSSLYCPRVTFASTDQVVEIPEGSATGLRGLQQLSAAKASGESLGEACESSGLGQLTAGRHEAVRLRIEQLLDAEPRRIRDRSKGAQMATEWPNES